MKPPGAVALFLRTCTVTAAKRFCHANHRKLPDLLSARWAVRVVDGSQETVGIATVGNPSGAFRGDVPSVTRVAVIDGYPNACSMLYGSCSRVARAMGADGLVTYTHLEEHGESLRGAGWICDGLAHAPEGARIGRIAKVRVDDAPKWRWWAPWSVR